VTDSNVELAMRFVAAINERRPPEEILAPDFTMENVSTAVTDRTYFGVDGVREWISDFFDVLEDPEHTAQPVAAGDDYVIARLAFVGRGAVSGAPVDLRFYGVLWIIDGKLTRAVGYATRQEAFEAVGLDP
jgi:ketosteroid isomerase-like protein